MADDDILDVGAPPPVSEASGPLSERQAVKLEHEIAALRLHALNTLFAVVIKALVASAGLAAALALGVAIWDAGRAHDLVVEPFHTPPDFAQKGWDGEVLAARVLDRLSAMRRERNEGLRAVAPFSDAGGQDLKLQIPSTGVSIGELRRALRDWLGHDTRISGALARGPGGLELTARAGGEASTFTGPEAQLGALIDQAAEAIFRTTQPLAYADYLRSHDRPDDAIAVLTPLTLAGPRADRAWALLALGETLALFKDDAQGALLAYRSAAALEPRLWLVWEDLADLAQFTLHEDEQALLYRRRAAAADDFGGSDREFAHHLQAYDRIYAVELVGDFGSALKLASRELATAEGPDGAQSARIFSAYELAYLHDLAGSEAMISQRPYAASLTSDAAEQVTPTSALRQRGGAHAAVAGAQGEVFSAAFKRRRSQAAGVWGAGLRVQAWRRTLVGDWRGAADLMEQGVLGRPVGSATAYYFALQAIWRARAGQAAEAAAIVSALPLNCSICSIARGYAAEAGGDRAGADRALAEAVRLGPSLPRSRVYWGQLKLARGDAAGALTLFRAAAAKGPRFADARQGWGEALLAQGDAGGAEARFSEATDRAPAWGRARLLRGEALLRLGRRPQARAELERAAALALSPAERATLDRLRAAP